MNHDSTSPRETVFTTCYRAEDVEVCPPASWNFSVARDTDSDGSGTTVAPPDRSSFLSIIQVTDSALSSKDMAETVVASRGFVPKEVRMRPPPRTEQDMIILEYRVDYESILYVAFFPQKKSKYVACIFLKDEQAADFPKREVEAFEVLEQFHYLEE